MRAAELYWLAGLLEGEGSFMAGPPSRPRMPVLAIHMTDEDVMQRVGRLVGRKPVRVAPANPRWRVSWQLRLTGAPAVALMRRLHPLMGKRRQEQIDRALACYDPRPSARLSDRDAEAALAALADGESVRRVAERFGVSVWCIYDLRSGRTRPALDRAAAQAARRATRRARQDG